MAQDRRATNIAAHTYGSLPPEITGGRETLLTHGRAARLLDYDPVKARAFADRIGERNSGTVAH